MDTQTGDVWVTDNEGNVIEINPYNNLLRVIPVPIMPMGAFFMMQRKGLYGQVGIPIIV